jgi:hypothetical protein
VCLPGGVLQAGVLLEVSSRGISSQGCPAGDVSRGLVSTPPLEIFPGEGLQACPQGVPSRGVLHVVSSMVFLVFMERNLGCPSNVYSQKTTSHVCLLILFTHFSTKDYSKNMSSS